jgi:hypothetical protein
MPQKILEDEILDDLFTIGVKFEGNFWPSKDTAAEIFLVKSLIEVANHFSAPILNEDGWYFVLLYWEDLGPISIFVESVEQLNCRGCNLHWDIKLSDSVKKIKILEKFPNDNWFDATSLKKFKENYTRMAANCEFQD